MVTPQILKYVLDIIVLLFGVIILLEIRKAAFGGVVGAGMKLILIGMAVLAVNHFLDTAFLAATLTGMGHTKDFYQPAIIHRVINLSGFLLILLGYKEFAKAGGTGNNK